MVDGTMCGRWKIGFAPQKQTVNHWVHFTWQTILHKITQSMEVEYNTNFTLQGKSIFPSYICQLKTEKML